MAMKLQYSFILFLMSFATISAQSQNCVADFDLQGVQNYDFKIPNSDQEKNPNYWDNTQLNYYVFGKFDDSSSDEETKITAGLYNGPDLIYKTVINCDKGTWANTIYNRASKDERILHGKIDVNDTSCKAGDPFDLILKVNNFYQMSWIFNAQPLQHGVREFCKPLQNQRVFQDDGKTVKVLCREDVKRPKVKVSSKHSAYKATRFVLKATGRAKFERLAFGQCNAWPNGMENQCQQVRSWVHSRSKANLTDETFADHIKEFPLDVNISRGLGVFGNNRLDHSPVCFSNKYFHFMQALVHPDRNIPKTREYSSMRTYCCCTNMRTGQVFENNLNKYCMFTSDCLKKHRSCFEAYDPKIANEIEDEANGIEEEPGELESTDIDLAVVLTVNNTDDSTGVLAKIPSTSDSLEQELGL